MPICGAEENDRGEKKMQYKTRGHQMQSIYRSAVKGKMLMKNAIREAALIGIIAERERITQVIRDRIPSPSGQDIYDGIIAVSVNDVLAIEEESK
jgi:hypothetical protein